MPTYNAKCPNCGHEMEYLCKISERETALPDCEKCKTKTETAFMPNTQGFFILKGSGWYKKVGY